MSHINNSKLPFLIGLLLIAALAFCMRTPTISTGLPYFYNEDEAHHFNRVLRMAKSGDMDPNYFHKPSLHFYLRIPVVWATAWYAKRIGIIGDLSDIKTKDPYGIGGYAFWTFPPIFAKSSRLLSVLLSVSLVILTGLVARMLTQNNIWALYAALLVAISPAQIEYAGVIGVDVLMAFMCLLTTMLAIRCYQNYSEKMLFLTALVAGLAVSSKYNALPVAVLPLVVCYLSENLYRASFLIACIAPLLGFVLGSPYILVHPEVFSSQLGYEVWHYAVAGHVGHETTPGFSQAAFYLNWLTLQGLGFGGMLLALLGLYYSKLRTNKISQIILAAPLFYFLLMIAQKTNFERNMLVLVPYLAIFGACFLTRPNCNRIGKTVTILLALLALVEPSLKSYALNSELISKHDSRTDAATWLNNNKVARQDTALAGELQFEPTLFSMPGTIRVNAARVNPLDLYMAGIDRFVFPAALAPLELSYLRVEKNFEGALGEMRVVDNPKIQIFRFEETPELTAALAKHLLPPVICKIGEGCSRQDQKLSDTEPYVWLERRIEPLRLEIPKNRPIRISPEEKMKIKLKVMSPWPNQTLRFEGAGTSSTFTFDNSKLGHWQDFDLEIQTQAFIKDPSIFLITKEIHSPAAWGINQDTRRLGVALETAQ